VNVINNKSAKKSKFSDSRGLKQHREVSCRVADTDIKCILTWNDFQKCPRKVEGRKDIHFVA
jgi:hypothetical protein